MEMLVRDIVAACKGKLLCGDENTVIHGVSTDSRKIAPSTLFVPIKGERTDAHDYIASTFEKGAAATLTQEHDVMQDTHAWIKVDDTQTALQQIAAAYRAQFDIPVIGITGSVGKTTTKEMVALVLSAQLNIMYTDGNFNSQVGLPLTMFRIEPEHQAAVIEMGMSNFGEMSRLAQIASPSRAIMTNIGISHIEQLKTQGNIMAEKLHITDRFDANSILFLNGDDTLLAGLKDKFSFKTVYFGTQPWCDYCAQDITSDGQKTVFTLVTVQGREQVVIPVLGIHNVSNALAAIAVANSLGIASKKAISALSGYRPLAMRQQIHNVHGITVIDDSYNASPDSMVGSMNVLSGLNNSGKTIAVLADMLELGELSQKAHFSVGKYCAKTGVNVLITVGERAAQIAEGARSANCAVACYQFQNNEQAIAKLHEILHEGDSVMVKGSRSMHTDEIVKDLLQLS